MAHCTVYRYKHLHTYIHTNELVTNQNLVESEKLSVCEILPASQI